MLVSSVKILLRDVGSLLSGEQAGSVLLHGVSVEGITDEAGGSISVQLLAADEG